MEYVIKKIDAEITQKESNYLSRKPDCLCTNLSKGLMVFENDHSFLELLRDLKSNCAYYKKLSMEMGIFEIRRWLYKCGAAYTQAISFTRADYELLATQLYVTSVLGYSL